MLKCLPKRLDALRVTSMVVIYAVFPEIGITMEPRESNVGTALCCEMSMLHHLVPAHSSSEIYLIHLVFL